MSCLLLRDSGGENITHRLCVSPHGGMDTQTTLVCVNSLDMLETQCQQLKVPTADGLLQHYMSRVAPPDVNKDCESPSLALDTKLRPHAHGVLIQ